MARKRRYPANVQTFSKMIQDGYVYIDKTDLMWQMVDYSNYVFLSRPRRFGKSLLSSTLHSYFDGDRELFEGLKIMELEKEWKRYPVIHLDLSVAKGQESAETLRDKMFNILRPYWLEYGRDETETQPGSLLEGIIRRAYERSSSRVAVIIDEYDAPLLDALDKPELLEDLRSVMQEFYVPLKAADPTIKFCFITGITKFSQLSIFSTINNLSVISMLPRFSTICGITDEEIDKLLADDIADLAKDMNCTAVEMREKLRLMYDGYHFSENSEAVYNPFSLFNALQARRIQNYWFSTGTPRFLINQMKHFRTDITTMDGIESTSTEFDLPTEGMNSALPILYQAGYLTIKDYDASSDVYTLCIPNKEVRVGFTQGLLPEYTGLNDGPVQRGFALKFWNALRNEDIDLAMREMQSYLAGLPYVEGFKKKLEEVNNVEGFYEWSLYLIFSMLNVYVVTQQKCAGGRVDVVVHMPSTIYVLELKINGTAQDALQQINSHNYALPYATSDKRVVKVGISFSVRTKTVEEWIVE
ncbi:MAG: AAA family ATPase [Bacteroidaceae bacterium]|nr:AAA family ATPase [Bacteroidaceae bacterium]